MQKAFVEHDAFQCGYCTPGQICSAVGLIKEGHGHSRAEIREMMSGNLCRCGACINIADAIKEVLGVSGPTVPGGSGMREFSYTRAETDAVAALASDPPAQILASGTPTSST